MKLSKQVIFALVFSPLFSQAADVSLCGLTFNPSSHYGQQEKEGSGYRMRVDCNRDQKEAVTDPVAVIQSISPARKGWITRFTQTAVKIASEKGDVNARNQAPYVCMDVTVDQDPCEKGAPKKVSILSIKKMTVANVGKYLNQTEGHAESDLSAGADNE